MPAPTSASLVLELRAQGLTYAQIAAELECSKSWVGEIVRAQERLRVLEEGARRA